MWCRIVQRILMRRRSAGRDLPGRVGEHLARCPRCRQADEQLADLADGLRADTPPEPDLPPALRERILRAAKHARPGSAAEGTPETGGPSTRITLRPVLVMAAAASVLLAITLAALFAPVSPPPPGGSARTPPPAVPGPDDVTEPFWQGVDTLANDPVEAELARLAEDARELSSGMLACIPGDLMPAGEGLIDALLAPAGPARRARPAPTSGPQPG